jgi:transcriptional regulator with XRE-family HTH domain
MHQIHAGQIKAARAYLDWTREDLAQATGLSINTIRNLELGFISPRGKTTFILRQAIEDAGLEFTEDKGIRPRTEDIKILQGPDSCDTLFEDILQTVKKKGGEIDAIFSTQEMMARSIGVTEPNNPDRLDDLDALADVKCLLSKTIELSMFLSRFEFRTVPKHCVSPVPFFVYGDKHALVLPEGGEAFRFVVIRSLGLAQSYRSHFSDLWETAAPILDSSFTKERRVRA